MYGGNQEWVSSSFLLEHVSVRHHGVGRPVKPVVLNDSERSFLQGVVDAGHVGKQAQMRCRAILLCAEGLSNGEVGEKLGISNNRVSILRSRFLKSCAQEQSDTVVERSRVARNGEISAATRRWAYGSRGKSANPVQLTREERFALENCLCDLDTPSAIATRCRIILLCTDGLSDRAIAKELSLSSNTVRDWRARFLKDRINGLLDKRKANRGYRLVRGLGGPAIDLVRDGRVSTPPAVVLDEDERLSLKSLALGLRGTGARSDRCRMILRCADGLTNEEVAADLGVGRQTVDRWQRCFLEDGIWGLLSRPWLGLGPPLTSEQAAEVINRSLNTTPVDAPRWTAQGMAEATGQSTTTVQRIWSALGVYPRPRRMLELSQNPLFVERVRGIAGLYLQPPVRAMVLCVEDRGYRRASCRGGTLPRRGRAGSGAAGRRFRPGDRRERDARRAAVRAGFREGPATTALHATDHLDRAEKLRSAVHGEPPLRPPERNGVSNPETERRVVLPHPLQATKPGRPRLDRTRNPRWRGDCITR